MKKLIRIYHHNMLTISGRSFTVRRDGILNLEGLEMDKDHSLYEMKNQHYLCPNGNESVQEDRNYTIRSPFTIAKSLKRIKNLRINDNPFMKFGQDYVYSLDSNEKIFIREITEQWNVLDDQIK